MSSDEEPELPKAVPADPVLADSEQPQLREPSQVGREALGRVIAAARSRGAMPGQRPRRAVSNRGATPGVAGRDPVLVGGTLEALLAGQGWQQRVSVGSVRSEWASIVGPDIAEHCTPEEFDGDALTVRADSTAWATQLSLLSAEILAAIARNVGDGAVARLTIKGPQGRSFKRGPRAVPGRGVRDTYG